jgi:transcriptional regulator with XRE-family HTH domain
MADGIKNITVNDSVGARLKTLRTAKSISVNRVYQRLSMSRSTLNRLDRGLHDIRCSELVEYADLLGYDIKLVPQWSTENDSTD